MRPDPTRSAPLWPVCVSAVCPWGGPQKPYSQDGEIRIPPPPHQRCIADTLSHRRAGFCSSSCLRLTPMAQSPPKLLRLLLLLFISVPFSIATNPTRLGVISAGVLPDAATPSAFLPVQSVNTPKCSRAGASEENNTGIFRRFSEPLSQAQACRELRSQAETSLTALRGTFLWRSRCFSHVSVIGSRSQIFIVASTCERIHVGTLQ